MTEDVNPILNEDPPSITASMINPDSGSVSDDASPDRNHTDDLPLTGQTTRRSYNVSLVHASLGIKDYDDDEGYKRAFLSQHFYPESERTLFHNGRQHSFILVETAVRDDSMIRTHRHTNADEDQHGDGDDLRYDTGQNPAPDPPSYLEQASPMHDSYTYREHLFVVILGMLLSFNSGFSNGVTLSGALTPDQQNWSTQSTSGYTGIYTASALALADTERDSQGKSRIEFFGFQICMILSFALGACISALLNPRPLPWRLAPMYAPTFLLGGIFMCIAGAMSSVADDVNIGHRFYFFVALANGVQNGISSMYSANLIRTTHMSGTTTDIGLFIGQWLRGNRRNTWKLHILLGLAASFWTGGLCSFYAVEAWVQYTLLFNAGIFLLLFAGMVVFLVRTLHMPVHRAIRGTWHWQQTLYTLSFRSKDGGVPKSDAVLREAFDNMDTDKDGFIGSEDLYRGLQEAGLDANKLPKATVDAMFEVADRNHDGRLSFSEFQGLVHGENIIVG